MSLSGKEFKLNDGNTIPAIAYGTGTKWFKFGNNEVDQNLVSALKLAIKTGFTHIDGAEVYNTSLEIGEAISASDRKSLYITEKFFVGDSSGKAKSQHGLPYDSLKWHLDNQLKTDHVDLYLLHAPFVKKEVHGFTLAEAWQSLEKLVEDGLTKSIGVSNFAVEDLEEILKVAKIKPAVNQIEFNAYLQNQTPGIVEFSQKHGILVEAYSPLGPIVKGEKGEFTDLLDKIGAQYNKNGTQVLLRWVLQRNILPVTTSGKEERLVQFLDVFNFELTEEEVKKITEAGLKHKTLRQYWTPEYSKYD